MDHDQTFRNGTTAACVWWGAHKRSGNGIAADSEENIAGVIDYSNFNTIVQLKKWELGFSPPHSDNTVILIKD